MLSKYIIINNIVYFLINVMKINSLKNNNSFFLDIWNHLIKINEKNIFIVFDIEGNIWFALKDLIKSLGYKSLLNIYKMKIPNEYISKIENIKVSSLIRIPYNFQPKTTFINEEGLNYILIRSNKVIKKSQKILSTNIFQI
jgi:hypothetical protein